MKKLSILDEKYIEQESKLVEAEKDTRYLIGKLKSEAKKLTENKELDAADILNIKYSEIAECISNNDCKSIISECGYRVSSGEISLEEATAISIVASDILNYSLEEEANNFGLFADENNFTLTESLGVQPNTAGKIAANKIFIKLQEKAAYATEVYNIGLKEHDAPCIYQGLVILGEIQLMEASSGLKQAYINKDNKMENYHLGKTKAIQIAKIKKGKLNVHDITSSSDKIESDQADESISKREAAYHKASGK